MPSRWTMLELCCTDITDSLSKSNNHSHNSLTIIRIWPNKKYPNRNFWFSIYSYWMVYIQLVIHFNKRHITFTLVTKSIHCNIVHIRSVLFWHFMQQSFLPPFQDNLSFPFQALGQAVQECCEHLGIHFI